MSRCLAAATAMHGRKLHFEVEVESLRPVDRPFRGSGGAEKAGAVPRTSGREGEHNLSLVRLQSSVRRARFDSIRLHTNLNQTEGTRERRPTAPATENKTQGLLNAIIIINSFINIVYRNDIY